MQKVYGFILESIPRFLFFGLLIVLFTYLYTTQSYAAGWTQVVGLGSNRIGGLVVDPTNPNIIYAGTDNGLYKSTDGGSTWNNFKNGLPSSTPYINGLVINPANTNILYAILSVNGVYKSTDGGVNWVYVSPQITTFTVFEGIAIDPNNPDTVYVAIYQGGFWKSTDGGATWTKTLGGDPGSPIVDSIQTNKVYVGDGPDWYKSTDSGTTWTATPPGTFGSGGGVSPTAIDSSNHNLLYVGVGGSNQDGLYKSIDDGTSWTFLSNYPGGPFGNQDLATDSIRPNTVYTSSRDYAHIYRSTDAGASWAELTGGNLASPAKTLLVPINNPGVLYAGTYAGLYYYNLDPETAPVISPLSNVTINEGDTYTASGSFTDPDSTSWTATVNYGDGSGTQPLTLSGTSFTLSHLYTNSGTYYVAVNIKDNQGATEEVTAVVTVNTPPIINALNNITINEGDTYTASGSFTDPDSTSWTATVDYGDGGGTQPLPLNSDKTFSLSHLYKDNQTNNAPYTVTVKIMDNQGLTGTGTATVTVNNVAPTPGAITVSNPVVQVNNSITASANFTDPGVLDTHNNSGTYWNWGDGNTTTGTVTEPNGTTPGSVSNAHTYSATGVYTITLTVTDKDGGVGTSTPFQYVAVYDSSTSFAGGRSFDNPSSASPNTAGKVSFGISAKYNNSNIISRYLKWKGISQRLRDTQWQLRLYVPRNRH